MASKQFTVETSAGPVSGTATDGSGMPLLLLHGGPGLSDYLGMLDGETAGWRTIRYQQRGLPPSATAGPLTVEQNVADAMAVLDGLGVDRAILLGHSWGGHLALHLALAAPDRVAGIVSVDPLGGVGDGGVAEMGQHLAERLGPGDAAAYARVAERLASPDASDDDMTESLRLLWPGYFAGPGGGMPFPPDLRLSLRTYADTFTSVAEHLAGGFSDRLAAIDVPVIFVLGEQSPMPSSQGYQTAERIPNAEVVMIPGAGHLPWYETPGCVAQALARLR